MVKDLSERDDNNFNVGESAFPATRSDGHRLVLPAVALSFTAPSTKLKQTVALEETNSPPHECPQSHHLAQHSTYWIANREPWVWTLLLASELNAWHLETYDSGYEHIGDC